MKKILFVFILAAFIAAGTAFADHPSGFGIGVHGGYGGIGGGGGLNLKFPSLPIFFYIDTVAGSNNYFSISGAGDFYFIHNSLVKEAGLHWYLGFGVGVSLWGFNDTLGLAAAARLPIGLSWQPVNFLEIFLQIVPQIGARFIGSDNGGSGFGLGGNFWCGNLGLRIWL